MKTFLPVFVVSMLVSPPIFGRAADAPKPIKILLITGGCCHDYKTQKDILKKGLEARANVVVDQMHAEGDTRTPKLPLYENPDYAKGYDLVIHDECAADITDPAVIAGVLKPHAEGVPAVNLHCAMHSYRFGNYQKPVPVEAANGKWYEYIGLQSYAHGPQEPIAIRFLDPESALTKGFADWTTIKEELYNNVQILPTAKPLARGKQIVKSKVKQADGTEVEKEQEVETVVVWTRAC
jgi:hypothetical protein